MARRKNKAPHESKAGGRFAALPYDVLNSDAYLALSNAAARLLFELVKRFNGHNNGEIAMSQREALELLRTSPRKVGEAFDALMMHGFIELATEGTWSERHAREWRLTWITYGKGPPYQPPSLAYRGWEPDRPVQAIQRKRTNRAAGRPATLRRKAPPDQSSVTAVVAGHGNIDTRAVAEDDRPVTAVVAVPAAKSRNSADPENVACYRMGDAYKLPCPPAPAYQPGQGDGGHGSCLHLSGAQTGSAAGHRSNTSTAPQDAIQLGAVADRILKSLDDAA